MAYDWFEMLLQVIQMPGFKWQFMARNPGIDRKKAKINVT